MDVSSFSSPNFCRILTTVSKTKKTKKKKERKLYKRMILGTKQILSRPTLGRRYYCLRIKRKISSLLWVNFSFSVILWLWSFSVFKENSYIPTLECKRRGQVVALVGNGERTSQKKVILSGHLVRQLVCTCLLLIITLFHL